MTELRGKKGVTNLRENYFFDINKINGLKSVYNPHNYKGVGFAFIPILSGQQNFNSK